MGCTLYPARSAAGYTLRGHRGHAYERKPWRKGWSPHVTCVRTHEAQSHASTNFEANVLGLRVSRYIQVLALLAHSCTFIGLSVGSADRPNAPPPHTQVIFRQGNVAKNRRHIIMYYPRPPDHQQPSRKGPRIPARPDMCTSVAHGFPTRLVTSVIPTPHSPDRPEFRMASMRALAGGVRPEAGLPPDFPPPPPGRMVALCISGVCRWGFWITGVRVGRSPGATDVPVAGRAGVRAARAGWRLMFGGRADIRRRSFSTSSSLQRTYVPG